ncbi:hypothetical protein BaRGS_00004802 [Batillaria attramentaria]|uniref:Uncharacterized protein n=1 Tax=Batillaria attramentaria TaxID=370345 RepID=A0ABD0LX06_9CAEN
MSLPLGSEVRVLADVAADFPQPFVLRAKKRSRSKDRVRRLSRALNPKNWRKTRAGPEQEELPPPNAKVSGLLTLSLQPSQAKSNEYLSDHLIEQPSPTRRHDSHAGEISKFSVNTTRSDTGQGEGNRSSTMPPMFDRERQEIRPRPRKNRPGLSPHQSGDRNETERSREARSPEQSKGSQHSPEKDSTERTERKREMRSPGGRRSPGHSTQRSPDSQSHRSPEHMRQSRSPESLSRDKHTRPKPRQSPEKPSQGNNGSEATSRDGRARPRQTQSSEIHTSSSRERESPAASGRKDRSRPVKSGHPETLSPKSSPQDRPEKDEKQALSSVEHAYENAWQARSSPKPSPRMRHGKSDLRQSPDRAKEFQDVEEKSEGSPEIKPDRPVRPRRERGGERRSPRKPAEDTAHISSSDSCPSELFEKSRGPQSAEDIPRTGDWSESTQAKSTDSSTDSKSPPREKARGRRVRSPNGATAPRRPQRQAVAVTESDSSEKESSRKGPSTDSTESGADGSDTNHKTSRDTRDNSKGRSPILMKPSVPPKPKYTPKQQAPMQFLMGPPPPTAPPRKRAARIGSVEAEMFSEGSAAKPRLFGRKQAQ